MNLRGPYPLMRRMQVRSLSDFPFCDVGPNSKTTTSFFNLGPQPRPAPLD